jgi:putative membrane protein
MPLVRRTSFSSAGRCPPNPLTPSRAAAPSPASASAEATADAPKRLRREGGPLRRLGRVAPSRQVPLLLGVGALAAVWFGPLPSMAIHSFAAHMVMHIAVVAFVAPLIALALAGTNLDPVRIVPRLMAPIPISLIELLIVWAWHVPALHRSAREYAGVFVLEQASFLVAGVLLWMAAIGGEDEQRRVRAGAGIVALLFTSMHMTLLGALFALSGRPLFQHAALQGGAAATADQQLGGVIMLLVGGAAYLVGGLWLTAVALRPEPRSLAIEERSA